MAGARRIKTKAKCCKSGPRCKKCPVVYKRLESEGVAVRESKRVWVVVDLSAKQLKAARRR